MRQNQTRPLHGLTAQYAGLVGWLFWYSSLRSMVWMQEGCILHLLLGHREIKGHGWMFDWAGIAMCLGLCHDCQMSFSWNLIQGVSSLCMSVSCCNVTVSNMNVQHLWHMCIIAWAICNLLCLYMIIYIYIYIMRGRIICNINFLQDTGYTYERKLKRPC